MARIVALDYGRKRTGIAVTDPLQLIATALTTVETRELIGFLKQYTQQQPVAQFVIGYPLNMDGSPTDATPLVERFIPKLEHVFRSIPVARWDERMTSKMAADTLESLGLPKKERERKDLIDAVSATIILQGYLESNPR